MRLWMELAWQFGMPLAVLQEQMPSHEFSWWKAFSKIRLEEMEAAQNKAKSSGGMRNRSGTMGRG